MDDDQTKIPRHASTPANNVPNLIDFLAMARGLKTTLRTGWVRQEAGPRIESVADHSWRISLMAMVMGATTFHNTDHCGRVDTTRLLQMALVHDLAESVVGDITPYCGVSDDEKHQREYQAMQQLTIKLGSETGRFFLELWQEYEKGETLEAKICKDLDKLEMILQALEYETDGQNKKSLNGFFDSTRNKWRTTWGAQWAHEIEARRKPPPQYPTSHATSAASRTTATTWGRCGFAWHVAASLGLVFLFYCAGLQLQWWTEPISPILLGSSANKLSSLIAVVSTMLISMFLAAPMIYFVINSTTVDK